jgi:hypothetical protein
MTEARCAVCERALAPGDWVYATRREDKWVHGGCLDVGSAKYWRGATDSVAATRPKPKLDQRGF